MNNVGYSPNNNYIPNAQVNTAAAVPYNAQQASTVNPNTQINNGVTIPIDAQKAASSSGVNIVIYNPSVNPNGANFNNTVNNAQSQPGQAYPANYYVNQPGPLAANGLKEDEKKAEEKKPKKDIVQLTDEYVQTLENYLRNPNPDIKLMGAKELMKRFREDESRKNDIALTNLLNLTLQSKYSQVKMVGMAIVNNKWASGDQMTRQLLAQIQQSDGSYGLDALDASEAALKSAGKTIKVTDNNPDYSKEKKSKDNKAQ